ncbi:MAG: hypothetical protein M3376_03685 [Actinomycetota bacterium]|nr:hypothetical protein [Actinomycetota bacterium]
MPATGLLGGLHVTVGLLALVMSIGVLTAVMPASTAHVLGSLTFGIGFVFLTVGRSELFTEDFLIPVAAAIRVTAPGAPSCGCGRSRSP